MNLAAFLESKGQEYAPFDPKRAHRIYAKLAPMLKLENLKVIHILGTNGKGSTGRFATLGLLQCGYNVLHFSSPHLWRFNERFYRNGADVSDEDLEEAHCFLQAQGFVNEASYFEYATFLALYLAQKCEFLVLEAGLGGEFDSTSVLSANLSVFTPIGFDHKDFLGTNIESIAGTKLRAMGSNVLLAPQAYVESTLIAQRVAKDRDARLFELACIESSARFWAELEAFCVCFGLRYEADCVFWQEYRAYVARYGYADFLAQNLLVASFALYFFGIKIDFKTLPPLNLRGRCEWVTPRILLDVGHNEECAKALKSVIEQKFKQRRVILVYNTYFDKEVRCILEILKPCIEELWVFPLSGNPRVIARNELEAILEDLGITYRDFMLEHMEDSKNYVVFGSFSVVAGFLDTFEGELCRTN
ncbi:bifunctional folylpolyglutamate synthase/dihydrofolate synthase [uncultured Helicobacter sp.]|uniref:bifunctional folylpolyglutamate synthase/dihydrofolate synthase n=1 Tax=uncultured Helicobacter sp. TaxID=175537 RepID=UPI001C3B27EC|nr:bifunctional folylpolyglutamate synthase/dihydrofolate synthase [Candidatus Helicobacter avicola]